MLPRAIISKKLRVWRIKPLKIIGNYVSANALYCNISRDTIHAIQGYLRTRTLIMR